MHVAPSELRTLRQEGVIVRFTTLDSMAFVLAELPPSGSRGTAMEQACTKPHWGFVISGEITVESEGRSQAIGPGSAFHVSAGEPAHRFRASDAARIAGFEPIDPVLDTSDATLAAKGFEVLQPESIGAATVIPAAIASLVDPKQIEVRTWPMSSLIMTQARFGPGSGYTTDWCDAPHWGMVTAGGLAIEWEDDIEILAAGDVYHCPGGPPGHRLEAADPASVIDLTPVEALVGRRRIAPWRRTSLGFEQPAATSRIAVAGLG